MERTVNTAFERLPPCNALEGQALKDIAIVCPSSASSSSSAGVGCGLLVLHARGRRLTECPLGDEVSSPLPGSSAKPTGEHDVEKDGIVDLGLYSSGVGRSDDTGGGAAASAVPPVIDPASNASRSWEISGAWLESAEADEESVESLAVDNDCGKVQDESEGRRFVPDEVGCVVVGTTSGRVVQLRRHALAKNQLVPEWAMQHRHSKVGHGSLHVSHGGFVMALRPGLGSVQALHSRQGHVIGEWRLPTEVEWLTIAGGGDSIFMLGRTKETKVAGRSGDDDDAAGVYGARQGDGQQFELWQFPVPPLDTWVEPPTAMGGKEASPAPLLRI